MAEYMIIAGKGSLPKLVKENLPNSVVVGFDSDLPDIPCDLTTNFAQVGKVIEFAKSHDVSKIIMAGAMKKPDFSSIKPDAEGAVLLAKIAAGKIFGGKGDDFILRKVIDFLEGKKFQILGVHEVLKNILAPKGVIGSITPTPEQIADIEFGMAEAKKLGKKDIGQAVIIENQQLLATEDENGTANLIERAWDLKKSYGGVLVKGAKPQQDMRVDLPSIGLATINQLVKAGIKGVAIESGKSLLLEKEEMIAAANTQNIFIFGV